MNLEGVKKASHSKESAELFRKNCFLRLSNEVEDKQKIIFSEKADFLNTFLEKHNHTKRREYAHTQTERSVRKSDAD